MKRNGSMLDPKMSELAKRMDNRYLLVNVTAQRAREIAQEAEDDEATLENKPVTIALHEIADGDIEVIPDAPHPEKETQSRPTNDEMLESSLQDMDSYGDDDSSDNE